MKRIAYCTIGPNNDTASCPLVDLYETGDELVFEIEVPGVDPECISLQVIDHFFVIESKPQGSPSAPLSSGSRFLCMERQSRAFRRILNIPIAVNSVKGTAWYRNGVISVRFPKLKGKWITIPIEQH